MKRILISISTVFLLALLQGCNKDNSAFVNGEKTGERILFSVSDDISLKSIVEDVSDLTSGAKVYVYGTKDGSEIKDTVSTSPSVKISNYSGVQLTYDSVTSLWDVATGGIWTYDKQNDRGYLYNFSAYAVSGPVPSEVTTSANNFGKSFTLVQPASYDGSEFTDYLLSNMTSVTSTVNSTGSARGQVVNLHMEHALAAIRVKVLANEDLYRVGVLGVEIKNFYRGATMLCTSQAGYGSGSKNLWSTTVPTYYGNSYTRGSIAKTTVNDSSFGSCILKLGNDSAINKTEGVLMDFIAIPQDAANAVLTISYIVKETNTATVHQGISYWNLSNYPGWDYGYRNTYTITIDTSNQLSATIDDWADGSSITGIILP